MSYVSTQQLALVVIALTFALDLLQLLILRLQVSCLSTKNLRL
jgi:hypothetical protein